MEDTMTSDETIEYEALPGEHVETTARRMQAMAVEHQTEVTCDFNGITLVARPGMGHEEIVAAFSAELRRRQDAFEASPEGKAAAKRAEEYRRKAEAAAAEGILPFKIRDEAAWQKAVQNNKDGYGACVIRYAARWANIMERGMGDGTKLEDIADKASHEADVEGITGFMYGAAVSILAAVWEHGEQLRRWHNLSTQLRDEGEKANESGGVLNPALLSMGGE